MNFFPNNINPIEMPLPFPNNYEQGMNNQNIFYKISELENRIKKLEQRITRLENENGDNTIPDNSLYMI